MINEVTREPVREAQVTLAPGSAPPAVTDSGGRFAFRNLPAGTYFLLAQHPEFPQMASGLAASHPVVITLLQDEQKSGAVIPLTPGGSISGRIADEDGKPVAGCHAQALQLTPGDSGNQLYGVRGADSDNQGEYRIFGLTKGHYYVSAQCKELRREAHGPAQSGRAKDVSGQQYTAEFYPDTPDFSGAARLTILAGANVPGIDFHLRAASAVTVCGRLSADAEVLSRKPRVELLPRDLSLTNLVRPGASANPQTGAFCIDGVPAGAYTLVATVEGAGHTYQAKAPVDIGATPPEPIELPLIPGADFSGTIEMDDSPPGTPLESLRVHLAPLERESGQGPAAKVASDGTFLLSGVLPGRWCLKLDNPHAYVKSLSAGAEVAHSCAFNVAPGAGGVMRVVVGTRMAQIEGTVSGANLGEANSVAVVLAPEDPGGREGTRSLAVDRAGRFNASGIQPGRYRLCAVPAAVAGALQQNPRVLKAIAERGTEVTLEAGSRATADVRAMPIEELTLAFQEAQ